MLPKGGVNDHEVPWSVHGNGVTRCDDRVAQHGLDHAWNTLALQPAAIPLHLRGRNQDPAALRSC